MIYAEYVVLPDGYFHEPGRNILLDAHGTKVNLALMYACRSTYQEMQDLPLKVNAVTFRSFKISESSERAGILHAMLNRVHSSNFCYVKA